MLQVKDWGQDDKFNPEELKKLISGIATNIIRQRELSLLKHEHWIQVDVFRNIYYKHKNIKYELLHFKFDIK